jgi:hypothetical protein
MLRLPHFLDNWPRDGSAGISFTHRPPFTRRGRFLRPPFTRRGRFLAVMSVRSWVRPRATVRQEGFGQLQNLMASLEVEPATYPTVEACAEMPFTLTCTLVIFMNHISAPSFCWRSLNCTRLLRAMSLAPQSSELWRLPKADEEKLLRSERHLLPSPVHSRALQELLSC